MSIFQILAVLFALFMIYVINIHRKKAMLSFTEVSFWYSTWFIFIIMAVFPHWLTGISGLLRFSRVFDLLIVGAFMVLTILVISNYFTQKTNSKKLEDLVRKIALDKPHEPRKK